MSQSTEVRHGIGRFALYAMPSLATREKCDILQHSECSEKHTLDNTKNIPQHSTTSTRRIKANKKGKRSAATLRTCCHSWRALKQTTAKVRCATRTIQKNHNFGIFASSKGVIRRDPWYTHRAITQKRLHILQKLKCATWSAERDEQADIKMTKLSNKSLLRPNRSPQPLWAFVMAKMYFVEAF